MDRHSQRNSTEYIRLNSRLCRACWKCIRSCPEGVIDKIDLPLHRHSRIVNADKCTGCLKCVKSCPQRAIAAIF